MPPQRRRPSSPSSGAPSMSASMASIDAKIKLIAQKLKILESNEQVISRTLTSQAKKLKEFEATLAAGGGGGSAPDLIKMKETLKEEIRSELGSSSGGIAPPLEKSGPRTNVQMTNLKKEVEELCNDVKEIKYVIDSINPLEYVTLDQLNDVVDRKLKKKE